MAPISWNGTPSFPSDGGLDLGELFDEALVVGAGRVKVGLGPLSADAQRVTGSSRAVVRASVAMSWLSACQ
jgi:hypothetical protein